MVFFAVVFFAADFLAAVFFAGAAPSAEVVTAVSLVFDSSSLTDHAPIRTLEHPWVPLEFTSPTHG